MVCRFSCFVLALSVCAAFSSAQVTGPLSGSAVEVVEADGVYWTSSYKPQAEAIQLPSLRSGLRGVVEYPEVRMGPVDLQKIQKEDSARESKGLPPRVGINRKLAESINGEWNDTPDGGTIWSAEITAEGAQEMRLHFENTNLPEGAELYVYSPVVTGSVAGPYSLAGPYGNGDFWAATVPGETTRVEYYIPHRESFGVPFDITEIGHMYDSVKPESKGLRSPLDCMLDVACYPAWEDLSYAVAKMEYSEGGYWYNCTGTLLATQNNDHTPYFLTSAHCIDTQAAAQTCQFRWFYQNGTCNGSPVGTESCYGSELLETSGYVNEQITGADWTLLLVKGALPAGVYWSGWTTANPMTGEYSVGIHHPSGVIKKWSRGLRYYGGANFHRILYNIGEGTIYYGSSGSGIWRESDQKLFGNCSFGFGEAGCDNTDVSVYYGRFASYFSTISSYLAGGEDDDLESNDTCASAVWIEEGDYSDLVVKDVAEDWYRVALGYGDQLEVNLSFINNYGNIDVQLYDTCGGSVVAYATTNSNNETLVYTNTGASADFFIRVFLSNDTRNTYDMSITGVFLDCNGSGIDDACDIDCEAPGCSGLPGCGTSNDCNGNLIPDECEADCNGNGIADDCEVSALVVAHPVDQMGCADSDSISLTVNAPEALGFQWYKGTTVVTNGGNISGADTAQLTFAPVGTADAGLYHCHVVKGCIEADSEEAEISVIEGPASITVQPQSSVVVCGGATAIFNCQASGLAISYQWYKDGIQLYNGGDISGVDTDTLNVANVEADDVGSYTCLVGNPCGSVESDPGVLLIDLQFDSHPQDTCGELGEQAVFYGHASSETPQTIDYYWYKDGGLLSDGGSLSGTRTETLTITGLTAADAGQYYVRVLGTTCDLYSDEATLQIGGCPACPNPGDMDGDLDYDLADLQQFTACFGADVTVEPLCLCANIEDTNNIVDLDDWAALEAVLAGPN